MKIVELSFKNENRQNDIRDQIQRSPGLIFHEFVVVLGALAVILDVLGSSDLEVDFERILRGPWAEAPRSGDGNTRFLAISINNQSGLKSRLDLRRIMF